VYGGLKVLISSCNHLVSFLGNQIPEGYKNREHTGIWTLFSMNSRMIVKIMLSQTEPAQFQARHYDVSTSWWGHCSMLLHTEVGQEDLQSTARAAG
jgi:hypothetical protein